MPYVTFLDRQVRKMGRIESVLLGRFPDAAAELMPQVEQVENLDELHELLEVAKVADLTAIRAAIESAVPPPK